MTVLSQQLETQRVEALQLRTAQLNNSLFTAPAISPFQGFGAEPSDQQRALQARNAPATAPQPDISTVAIDGSIGRLNSVLARLQTSTRTLTFDQERASDIKDFLETLRTDINERVREAADSFAPPSTPDPITKIVSLERVNYVSTDATVTGNISRDGGMTIGELNEGSGISVTVSAGANTATVSAGADETLADFIDRLNSEPGVTARLDRLKRVTLQANFGALLTVTQEQEGTFAALGINIADPNGAPDDMLTSITTTGTRTKELSIEKVTVRRQADSFQERLSERNAAIKKYEDDLQKDLQRFWRNADENVTAEVERSLDRGSTALTGAPIRVATADGSAGDRSIGAGNLSIEGLGLSDIGIWLEEGRFDDVNDAIETALTRVTGAQSGLSLAKSISSSETSMAQQSIGRLADERDAIVDAFTAQFVAQQTGLSLAAVQLATAQNRQAELRGL